MALPTDTGGEVIPVLMSTLLDDLATEIAVERPENSVTARELADKTGKTYTQAAVFLENKVKTGDLKTKQYLLSGKWTNVYYKP